MEQKLIQDINPGNKILSFYILRKKEVKQKKSSGDTYLSLEFGDSSGRITGSLWKNVSETNKKIHTSDIVKVKGSVITFMDKPHITIEKIRKATTKDNVDPKKFLPVCPENIEEMFVELNNVLAEIKEPQLNSLIKSFLNDKNFSKGFCQAPGGKLWHHAYLGGLLEHTLSVVKICRYIIEHYKGAIKTDILLTAAFLHDIGKIEEFSIDGFINYSTPGRLIGHINIGFNQVLEKISQIPNFSDEIRQQLAHCLLSHHGEKEKGSPVVPQTIEALMLSCADQIDSSVGAFQRIIEKEKEPGKVWSNYVNLIDRFVYLGEDE
ncbi:HD domain-containing protein [candidate division KSB1 bacterium]|nr:HD domain-containing protein [candidate division KSB1 bacterium]